MAKSTELVTIEQIGNHKKPGTTSLRIAAEFGIDHNYLLKKIAKLIKNGEIGEGTFYLSSYQSEQNKFLPMYILDNDAVIVLLPSFTGKKARKKTQQFFREFIKLSNRRPKRTGIAREKGDEMATLYKTNQAIYKFMRKQLHDKDTGKGAFSANAENMNEAVTGRRGKNENLRQNLTIEGMKRYLEVMGEWGIAMLEEGLLNKETLFPYLESKGLLEKNPDITKYLTTDFLEVLIETTCLSPLRTRIDIRIDGQSE